MNSRASKKKPWSLMKWVIFLTLNLCCVQYAAAANLNIQIGNLQVRKNVKSLKDLRYNTMVKQTRDYSCGAAALATIFTYYFGKETTEEQVLGAILQDSDEEAVVRIQKEGVTLLDLKKYSDSAGYKGAGFKMQIEDLKELDRPGIALIDYKGYHHFVVLKGVVEDKVYLADPAKGNMVKNLQEFQEMWNGILLVFKNPGPKIQNHALEAKAGSLKDKVELLPNLSSYGFAINAADF